MTSEYEAEQQSAFRAASDDIASESRRQFVTFILSGQSYCIDIMAVREIRISSAVTALPGAPEYIRGVINLRGTIVPVCDLGIRFGQSKTDLENSHAVVIAMINGKLTGLLVNEVCDILEVSTDEISPVPEAETGRRNPMFSGIISKGDTMLIVVALENLVTDTAPVLAGAA